MLKYKNRHGDIIPLVAYKELCIEEALNYGDKTLEFSIPVLMGKDIQQEDFILTRTDEFVIKQINTDGSGNFKVTAKNNIDELEGTVFREFEAVEQPVADCVNLALSGTGWTCNCKESKRRTIRLVNVSVWEILKSVADTYRLDLSIDSINKVITYAENIGADKGVYFADQLNLISLDIQSNTTDFYTRILPIGKDGLTITDINGGVPYLENYQYNKKAKTLIWKDERYTVAEALKEDAKAKLGDLAQPYTAYTCKVVDLAKCQGQDYLFLEYGIGDIVTIINKETHTRIQQRIVKLRRYPEEPGQNTCEISNVKLTFEQYVQKYSSTAETVNNITTDNGTVDGDAIDSIDAGKIERLDDVVAANGMFTKVSAEVLSISNRLTAVSGKIGTLETTKLSAADADLKYASIEKFNAVSGKVETLETTALTAGSAIIHSLTSDISKISTLMFGSASGGSLTTEFSNSIVSLIGDAQIKSAMIKDVSADKITSGKIYTNMVEVCSQSGNLNIKDNTLLIKDAAATPRIQVGKDAAGDYNMYVWDQSGQLMFDALGLTAAGIQRPVIRNDMVSDNANISAKKLDITSLFTEINGSSETIKSSRIYVDADKQTLDVAFKSVKTTAESAGVEISSLKETVTSQGTQLTAVQGQISSKVWQQDITKAVTPLAETTTTLSNQYTSLNQTLNSLAATVNSNTTEINKKADSSTVTSVQNTITSLQADLTGFKSSVSDTYTTKTEFADLEFGGRNMIAGTKDFTTGTKSALASIDSVKYNGFSVLTCEIPKTGAIDACTWYSCFAPEQDTYYTLSFYARAETDGIRIISFMYSNAVASGVNIQGQTTVNQDGHIRTTLSVQWKRYWVTWRTKPDVTGAKNILPARMQTDINPAYIGKKVYICGVKLEKGNKATDWTPAPEDVDASIAVVDSKFNNYTTTAALNSAIEQTASSITQSVSATYATKDSLTGYATTQSVNASLALKIDKTDTGQIVSMINASADEINLTSDRFSVDSTCLKIAKNGKTEFLNRGIGEFNLAVILNSIGTTTDYKMQTNGQYMDFLAGGVKKGGLWNSYDPTYSPDGGLIIDCQYLRFANGSGTSGIWTGRNYINMEVAGGWTEKTIQFGCTFRSVPCVFLQQVGGASMENMRVVETTKTYFTVAIYSEGGSGFENEFVWVAIN